jgi:transposase InsO family protein
MSERRAYVWLARERDAGSSELRDRPSRPKVSPRQLSSDLVQAIVQLRGRRLPGREIAMRLGLPRSTTARWLARCGLGRLPSLAPPEPLRRYEKEHPGELLHLDTKKLGRIAGLGHRVTGRRQHGNRGIGWEYLHVAIDDASRVAYVEMLEDERGQSAAGFLTRACSWFADRGVHTQRVLTDNGSGYVSRTFAAACQSLGLRHSRTRPYRPRTNGKAERLIQTLLREWAYGIAYTSSAARRSRLDHYLHFYNHHRAHLALGGKTPVARLNLNNVVGNHN